MSWQRVTRLLWKEVGSADVMTEGHKALRTEFRSIEVVKQWLLYITSTVQVKMNTTLLE
jgi:hypothetical protein